MRWLRCYRFRRTTLLLVGCLAFLGGVGLAHNGFAVAAIWSWPCAILTAYLFRKKSIWALVAVTVLGLSFGSWRGTIYRQKLAVYDGLYFQKVTLLATATDDAVYGKQTQLTFVANNILDQTSGQRLAGKITLSGFGLAAVYQGDTVEASGKLYPTLGANQASMSYAEMQVVAHHPSVVADIRRKFTAGMQSALPEPLASFAMGLLIGQRASLPPDVKQDLLMVGLTHIIAVSGYNLTIMLHASKKILGRRSKRLSTLLSLSLIGLFLLLAGTSASIVRAAIVSVLSIATSYYGRQTKPLLLIMLAATITAFVNPFYVWSDTSWYLSFLAFYGVMVVAPMVSLRLKKRWRNSLVVAVAIESLCAEMMTLPFILFTFGQMSFVGLVANVLVVTLIPLAMLLSMAAGLAGMLLTPISGWAAWPARLLLTYMLDVAHLLSGIPHIFVQNLSLPISEMILLYGFIIATSYLLSIKTKRLKYATVTDKETIDSS